MNETIIKDNNINNELTKNSFRIRIIKTIANLNIKLFVKIYKLEFFVQGLHIGKGN